MNYIPVFLLNYPIYPIKSLSYLNHVSYNNSGINSAPLNYVFILKVEFIQDIFCFLKENCHSARLSKVFYQKLLLILADLCFLMR